MANNFGLADIGRATISNTVNQSALKDIESENVAVDETEAPDYNEVIQTSAPTVKTNVNSSQFKEYIEAKQEKMAEDSKDDAAQKSEEKKYEREVASKLSDEEISQLKMMGIDIEGAQLSDLIGMVNTIRENAHQQETAELMAQIVINNSKPGEEMSGLVVVGGNVKAVGTDVELKNVDTSEIYLAQQKSEAKLSDDSATMEDFQVGSKELVYIIKNNLNLTSENMYKAHFSGSKVASVPVNSDLLKDIKSQLDRIIFEAGYSGNSEAYEGAEFLLANDLPVTTDSISKYMEFQTINDKNIKDIDLLADNKEYIEYKSKQLYEMTQAINIDDADEMINSNVNITLSALYRYKRNDYSSNKTDTDESMTNLTQNELKNITTRRQLEEIRLSMSLNISTRLVSRDINIDTRELSKVIDELKQLEQDMIKDMLGRNNVPMTDDNISIYSETTSKISELAYLNAKSIASPIETGRFTINALYEADEISEGKETDNNNDQTEYTDENHEQQSKSAAYRRYERILSTATDTYEAVGTQVRHDLGDSISKAFRNVDDMLTEMNLPITEENQRAVRILGYNSMEITNQNIEQVKTYDIEVNNLIQGFYPEAVLGLIRDGINPLNMDITELNKVIEEKKYNEGVTEADNFATFLRNMEKDVSPGERESYIGIYRAINKLAKSGDREAGWLFANGGDLTIRNLLTAARSIKASGKNITIDDNFGMLDSINIDDGVSSSRIDNQINAAFRESLSEIENYNKNVEEFIENNSIEYSVINAKAVNIMLNTPGGLYSLVSDILAKMKFSDHSKSDLIDEETENMTESINGEDIPVEFMPESILEHLNESSEMSLTYDDMRDKLTELMYQSTQDGTIGALEIAAIKQANAGFNVLSGLARNEKYQIPVQTEDGIGVINLDIIRNGDVPGIEISMSRTEGLLSMKVQLTGESSISGYMIMDSSDGNNKLAENGNEFTDYMLKSGYDTENISIGTLKNSSKMRDESEEGSFRVTTSSLYKASVAIVKAISSINK